MSIRAASRTGEPSTISATAAVAALVAPHPSESKETSSMRPSATVKEIRDRSPHAAPPAAPVKALSGTGPRRLSSPRKCSKSSRSIARRVERKPSFHPEPRSQGRHPHLLAGWVWVTALPQRLRQIRHNLVRFLLKLPPGDPHRPP